MKKWARLISFLVLASYSSGCATIFSGSSDQVTINSEPSGAKVYLNGNYIGNTPVTNTLKRDKDYNVMVKKDGYETGNATITRSFNAVAILNLVGILCWVVDIVTGAMWKFDQNAITVTLDKPGHAFNTPSGRVLAGNNMTVVNQGKKAIIYPSAAASN